MLFSQDETRARVHAAREGSAELLSSRESTPGGAYEARTTPVVSYEESLAREAAAAAISPHSRLRSERERARLASSPLAADTPPPLGVSAERGGGVIGSPATERFFSGARGGGGGGDLASPASPSMAGAGEYEYDSGTEIPNHNLMPRTTGAHSFIRAVG